MSAAFRRSAVSVEEGGQPYAAQLHGKAALLTSNHNQCNAQAADVVASDVHTGGKGSIVICGGELQAAGQYIQQV